MNEYQLFRNKSTVGSLVIALCLVSSVLSESQRRILQLNVWLHEGPWIVMPTFQATMRNFFPLCFSPPHVFFPVTEIYHQSAVVTNYSFLKTMTVTGTSRNSFPCTQSEPNRTKIFIPLTWFTMTHICNMMHKRLWNYWPNILINTSLWRERMFQSQSELIWLL